MAVNLYTVTIPTRLAVEAHSRAEAICLLRKLWREVMEELPTGAGVFAKDAEMAAHLRDNVALS